MRLLNINTLQMVVTYETKPYAILSHTWEGEEPTYQDFCNRPDEVLRGGKISGFISAAKLAGTSYVWIDTICIDKTSSSELQEAINSMFTWYAEALYCIAYLSDVTLQPYQTTQDVVTGDSRFNLNDTEHERQYEKHYPAMTAFLNSRWFTRGWTLQELIAPRFVLFYDSGWSWIISKTPEHLMGLHPDLKLLQECSRKIISKAACVPTSVLATQKGYQQASMAQRMSWAASRRTTRIEDCAYSLMGLFDVHMPMLYGEGSAAFGRLREEIMKKSNDHSLLAYNFNWHHEQPLQDLLSPASYSGCGDIFQLHDSNEDQEHYSMTNMGLLIKLKIIPMIDVPGMYWARLNCCQSWSVLHRGTDSLDTLVQYWSVLIESGKGGYQDYIEYYGNPEQERDDFVMKNTVVGSLDTIAIPLLLPPGLKKSNSYHRPTQTSPIVLPARVFETDAAVFKTVYIADKLYSGPDLGGALFLDFRSSHLEVVETYPPSARDRSGRQFIRCPPWEPPNLVFLQTTDKKTGARHAIRLDLTYGDRDSNYAIMTRQGSFDYLMDLARVHGAITSSYIGSCPIGTNLVGQYTRDWLLPGRNIIVVVRHEPAKIFIDKTRWPEYKDHSRRHQMRCLECGTEMSSTHDCKQHVFGWSS